MMSKSGLANSKDRWDTVAVKSECNYHAPEQIGNESEEISG